MELSIISHPSLQTSRQLHPQEQKRLLWLTQKHILQNKPHSGSCCVCSDHKGINPKIDYRKIAGKFHSAWRLNNTLLNDTQITQEISREKVKMF